MAINARDGTRRWWDLVLSQLLQGHVAVILVPNRLFGSGLFGLLLLELGLEIKRFGKRDHVLEEGDLRADATRSVARPDERRGRDS